MNTEVYEADLSLSSQVQEAYRQYLMKNCCYDNMWRLLGGAFLFKEHPEWRIAFGYVFLKAQSNLLIRHCFLLDPRDKVIECTIPHPTKEQGYYVIRAFTGKEYVNALSCSHSTDLRDHKPLQRLYKEFDELAFQRRMYCI